jgi:DNA-binding transcriptional LysR family regulator
MQDMNWNDLRYVLALARGARLASAARRLEVNEVTVARRLSRIEHMLGARLFERIGGRLVATEIGQVVIRQAEDIESRVEQINQTVTGADAKAVGLVRLTAVPMLLNRLLIPALPRLLPAHPMLQLHLIAEPRNLSLMQREADLALRFGRPEEEQRVIARRIADFAYWVYGPALLPSGPVPWIIYDSSVSLPHAHWLAKAAQSTPEVGPPLIVNDSDVIVHAVRAGLGRSLLPGLVGDCEPGLRRHGSAEPVLSRELWLLVHPEKRRLARVEVVIAWLEQILTEVARQSSDDLPSSL